MKTRGLTLLEVFVILIGLAILASLIPVLLAPARERARRVQCHNNLRSLVSAMTMYSDSAGSNGYFPTYVPAGGTIESAKGYMSLGLLYRQYVNDPRIFICPSDPTKPKLKNLRTLRAESTEMPSDPYTVLGISHTSYAYNPGHLSDNRVVIMSDKKSAEANSDNHGTNAGQNVSFITGVAFITGPAFTVEHGKADPNIFARNPELKFEEDSFLRE